MDMSVMKPPVGAVPVAAMAVKRQPIDATVRYTGSAVSFVDQDVYPRVTGWITWMPFYPGDRVRRGQLLARLDATELGSKVNEQIAARAMAEHANTIARTQSRWPASMPPRANAGSRWNALCATRSRGSWSASGRRSSVRSGSSTSRRT